MTVDLRPVAGVPDLFDAWGHDVRIGTVRLEMRGSAAGLAARLDAAPVAGEDLGDFVWAMVEQARRGGAEYLELHCPSLPLRLEARRAGLRGGLRVPLRARTGDLDRVGGPHVAERPADRRDRGPWLAGLLREMGVPAVAGRPARPLGRMARRLVGGVGDTVEVVVEWTAGRRFVISAPDRVDIIPEAMALAGDTAGAVFRRFPDYAAGVEYIYFDRAVRELMGHSYSGVAEGSTPSIRLHVGFVCVGAFLEMLRARTDGPPPARPSATAPPARPSSTEPPRCTGLDATVAHELWHRIESVFEARHYRSSMDFRRRLGAGLGVETLEHAVRGGTASAPADWRAAHDRLVAEVSAYASTNPHEATAEMFKLWWCGGTSVSPVVSCFGELVDEFLPGPP